MTTTSDNNDDDETIRGLVCVCVCVCLCVCVCVCVPHSFVPGSLLLVMNACSYVLDGPVTDVEF